MIAVARPHRSPWLMTLADLALLLVGFFAVVHAVDGRGAEARAQLSKALRSEFGDLDAAVTMDANRVGGFAPDSTHADYDLAGLARWVEGATRDPRSRLVVSGAGDALPLAAERAEAIAAALRASGAVPADRIDVEAHVQRGAAHVDLGIRYQ